MGDSAGWKIPSESVPNILSADKNFKDMRIICKPVLVLNHGQAFSEKGFMASLNSYQMTTWTLNF